MPANADGRLALHDQGYPSAAGGAGAFLTGVDGEEETDDDDRGRAATTVRTAVQAAGPDRGDMGAWTLAGHGAVEGLDMGPDMGRIGLVQETEMDRN